MVRALGRGLSDQCLHTFDNGIAAARLCTCAMAFAGSPSPASSVVDMYSARATLSGATVRMPVSATNRSTETFSGASLITASAVKAALGSPAAPAAAELGSGIGVRAGEKRRMAA